MKTTIALSLLLFAATRALAQPAPALPTDPPAEMTTPTPTPSQPPAPAPQVAVTEPVPVQQPPSAVRVDQSESDDGSWSRPAGRRFLHGFRIGYVYLSGFDKVTRDDGKSIKQEFGLKTPNMMLLGYEGFYRIVGHSWLNVLLVGDVTVIGLEQSKFIPAASGLIGVELDESFQLGVGVNVTPDSQSPSHMIAAAGWTPKVGAIWTPIHFFFIPDTAGNHRSGVTVGMTW